MRKQIIIIFLVYLSIIMTGCNLRQNKDDDMKKIDNEIINTILLSKKIVIEDARAGVIKSEILDVEEINVILDIMSNGYKVQETVTSEASDWYLFLYNSDNKLISKVWIWESGYFGFENDKEYSIFENIETLKNIINK